MQKFLQSKCKQTAVYWANPVNDGYNHFTFDAPVEIQCRWEDKIQILGQMDETGKISRAVVFVLQDVDENGMLYLGTLTNLSQEQKDDPTLIEGVGIIKRFEKSLSSVNSNEYLRKAFLTPWLS